MGVIPLREQDYCVIAFSNTHAAIAAQKVLERLGLPAHMMPTPREITAGCGLSLRCPPEGYAQARQAVASLKIPQDYCQFYRMTYDEHHRKVTAM